MSYVAFTGLANGALWPAYWTTGGASTFTSSIVDVQNQQGRMRAGSWDAVHARRQVLPLNADLTVKFAMTTPSNSTLRLGLRCDPLVGNFANIQPTQGYLLDLRRPGFTNMQLRRRYGGVDTILGTGPSLNVATGGTFLAHFRARTLNASSVEVRCKMWADGTPEPTWQMSFTDTSAQRLTTNPNAYIILQQDQYQVGAEIRVDATELTDANLYSPVSLTATDVEVAGVHSVRLDLPTSSSYAVERQAWTGRGRPQ